MWKYQMSKMKLNMTGSAIIRKNIVHMYISSTETFAFRAFIRILGLKEPEMTIRLHIGENLRPNGFRWAQLVVGELEIVPDYLLSCGYCFQNRFVYFSDMVRSPPWFLRLENFIDGSNVSSISVISWNSELPLLNIFYCFHVSNAHFSFINVVYLEWHLKP